MTLRPALGVEMVGRRHTAWRRGAAALTSQPMNKHGFGRLFAPLLTALVIGLSAATASAESPEPTPAFAGQTDAPAPAKPSPPLERGDHRHRADRRVVARVPAGRQLPRHAEQRADAHRAAATAWCRRRSRACRRRQGRSAAQGLHDVVLDPDFATQPHALLHLLRAAEGRGAGGSWPIEHFYESVWTQAARRAPHDAARHRARGAREAAARTSAQLEDVEVIAEGAERRIVLAPRRHAVRHGRGSLPLLRFGARRHGARLHRRARHPPQLLRPRAAHQPRRLDPEGQPVARPRAPCRAETFAHGFKDPEGAAIHPTTGELWVVDHGPQGGDEINIIRAGKDYGWPDVSYGVQYDARQADGRKNVPRRQRHARRCRASRSRSTSGCRRSRRRA